VSHRRRVDGGSASGNAPINNSDEECDMLFLGAAASSALDLLSFLQPQKVTQAGAAQNPTSGATSPSNGFVAPSTTALSAPGAMPSNIGTGSSLLDPNVMGFLIQSQGQQTANTGGNTATMSPGQAALLAKLDTNGDGTISKSEFEGAFGANGNTTAADTAFNKLDTKAGGAIDPSELAAARPHRHHHHLGGGNESKQTTSSDGTGATSGADSASSGSASGLASLLDIGGTSTMATNPDGSTATTITYADGSTITMTTPQQTSATTGSNSTSAVQPTANSTNSLETLIRLQAQLFSSATVAPPTT
jgi:hypothetical protein